MKEHLLTTEEVIKAGRPMGEHMDEGRLLAYITEVEMMNIKPVIGDKLFHKLLTEENEVFNKLLNGGTYTYKDEIYSFAGLKATISYYVFAKNVMVGDYQSTRYGMVMKNGDYSSHISSAQRSDCYNDTLEVANHYLKECVKFCKVKNLLTSSKKGAVSTGGMTIRKIG